MSLSKLELETVKKAFVTARIVLDSLKPLVDQLNVIYDSEGGAKSTITQQNLDADSSLSGLTKAQLDAGCYALTATLKGAIDAAVTQLTQLSARA